MPTRTILLSTTLFFGLMGPTPPTEAAVVDVLEDNGNAVELFTEDGPFVVLIDFENLRPVWLEVTRDESDGDTLDFGGLFLNDTTRLWTDFHVELEGARFGETPGEILTGNQVELDSAEVLVDLTAEALWLDFIPPEPLGLVLGVSLDDDGDDGDFVPDPFLIDLSGLRTGDGFSVHIFPTVPEPGTLALLGAACIALVVRRRR